MDSAISYMPHWQTFGWVLLVVLGLFLAYHFLFNRSSES